MAQEITAADISAVDEASSQGSSPWSDSDRPCEEDIFKTALGRKSRQSTNRKTTRLMFQQPDIGWEKELIDKFKDEGWAQSIARTPLFEWSAFLMICANAVWIGVDAETNDQDLLLNAKPIFQVAENIFCLYFSVEWFVRFKAFRSYALAFTDSWFIFDSLLVFLMVSETWAMTIILSMVGDTGLNPGFLSMLSLVRLSRMARMARLLRTSPELLIMVKGLMAAMKSVIVTMGMQLGIIYVFGIAMKQVADGTAAGDRYFGSVFSAMYSLAMHATLLDSPSIVLQALGSESFTSAALFFFVILLSSLLLLNMLIGVLCEVVSNVSSVEKETLAVSLVREKVLAVFEESGLDKDGNGLISKNELLQVLGNGSATQHLREAGVDVTGLVEFADIVFQSDTLGREFEKQLSMPEFMKLILQLRGTNTATVKDIVDLRKYMHIGKTETNTLLMKIDERLRWVEQTAVGGGRSPTKAGARTLSQANLSRAGTRSDSSIRHGASRVAGGTSRATAGATAAAGAATGAVAGAGAESVRPPEPLPQVKVPQVEECQVLPERPELQEEIQLLSARLEEKHNRIRMMLPGEDRAARSQASAVADAWASPASHMAKAVASLPQGGRSPLQREERAFDGPRTADWQGNANGASTSPRHVVDLPNTVADLQLVPDGDVDVVELPPH